MLTATIEELRSIALSADDASGYFPALYARVTERIELEAAGGRFADATRIEEFARAFAHWYLRLRPGDGPIPRCWQATFDVADDPHLMIVQHLVLGINAHINHDLPQVLVELAPEANGLAALRPDFDAVNDVLAETLPMVLRSLRRVSRWMNLVAVRGNTMFDFSLTVARSQAWNAAVRLQRLDPDARRGEVVELDRLVCVLAYLVAYPRPPVAWGVSVARRLEERDPATVTKQLLGDLA
jgi:Family of unknown function (DUF5995)